MIKEGKRHLYVGILLILLFAAWTMMIQFIDVNTIGETKTEVGFSHLNNRFFEITGVHLGLYSVTDWLGLVPIAVCFLFAAVGFIQLIKRKSLFKVDLDIILLGLYYITVILCYLGFEMYPINYRPILINGMKEASYPSSTTLLVISVMPTLAFEAERRLYKAKTKKRIRVAATVFTLFMIVGRAVSGVHWITDIVGAVLLGIGLFFLYKAVVLLCCKER